MNDNSTTGYGARFKRLLGWLALPGWFLFLWKWFWQLASWIGNIDVVRQHTNGWHLPMMPLPLSVVLFVYGLIWLTLVVLFGDRLIPSKPSERMQEMPASRPRVIAVRYGKRASDNRSGLFLANEGEPAYDITLPDVQFGSSKLVFHGRDITRLVKSDGEHLCETWVEQSSGNGLLGNGLFSEMVSQRVTEIAIPIRYKDGDNIHYVTRCKIKRDVAATGGLAVRYVGQEMIAVVAALSPAPARIKVSPVELRRTIRLHGKQEGRNIFLRAKLELLEPLQVTVTKYRMELSRDGVLDNLEFQDDLERWEITDWSQDPIPHDEMRPLPMTLTCGDLVEGWVHFVTERSDRELDQCSVKVFVDTPRGTGTAEIAAGRDYWNVKPNRMILEKDLFLRRD